MAAGWRVLDYSRTQDRTRRLFEAGLAGAILGFLQGVSFAVVLATASPLGLPGGSVVETLLTGAIALVVVGGLGAGVSAGLAVLEAYLRCHSARVRGGEYQGD